MEPHVQHPDWEQQKATAKAHSPDTPTSSAPVKPSIKSKGKTSATTSSSSSSSSSQPPPPPQLTSSKKPSLTLERENRSEEDEKHEKELKTPEDLMCVDCSPSFFYFFV